MGHSYTARLALRHYEGHSHDFIQFMPSVASPSRVYMKSRRQSPTRVLDPGLARTHIQDLHQETVDLTRLHSATCGSDQLSVARHLLARTDLFSSMIVSWVVQMSNIVETHVSLLHNISLE